MTRLTIISVAFSLRLASVAALAASIWSHARPL